MTTEGFLQPLSEQGKKLVPTIKEFFEALEKDPRSKLAKESPLMLCGETVPAELEDLFVENTNEHLKEYFPKVIPNVFQVLKVLEDGYWLKFIIEDFKVDEFGKHEGMFTDLVKALSLYRVCVLDGDENALDVPKFPFETEGDDVYSTFISMDSDEGYFGYILSVQEGIGASLILKYVDTYSDYEGTDSFEAVTYNCKTKELSFGSPVYTPGGSN